MSRGSNAVDEDEALTVNLFQSVGYCVKLPESLLNAVTGLSGSGPAYVSAFIIHYQMFNIHPSAVVYGIYICLFLHLFTLSLSLFNPRTTTGVDLYPKHHMSAYYKVGGYLRELSF